jgi:hypothetical protein
MNLGPRGLARFGCRSSEMGEDGRTRVTARTTTHASASQARPLRRKASGTEKGNRQWATERTGHHDWAMVSAIPLPPAAASRRPPRGEEGGDDQSDQGRRGDQGRMVPPFHGRGAAIPGRREVSPPPRDEPRATLDSGHGRKIARLLRELGTLDRRGVVIVSHDDHASRRSPTGCSGWRTGVSVTWRQWPSGVRHGGRGDRHHPHATQRADLVFPLHPLPQRVHGHSPGSRSSATEPDDDPNDRRVTIRDRKDPE